MLKITFRKYLQNHLHQNAVLAEEITERLLHLNMKAKGEAAKTYHMKKKKPVTRAGYLSRKPAGLASLSRASGWMDGVINKANE